jgi:hypothetical protein
VGVSRHMRAVKPAQPKMNDPSREVRWIEARHQHGRLQAGKVGAGERDGLHGIPPSLWRWAPRFQCHATTFAQGVCQLPAAWNSLPWVGAGGNLRTDQADHGAKILRTMPIDSLSTLTGTESQLWAKEKSNRTCATTLEPWRRT